MKTPVGPCIHWSGPHDRNGYGTSGSSRYAHRDAYEAAFGPIPAGRQVDHVCHSADPSCPGGPSCPHRDCINPDHLEAVTSAENKARGRNFMNDRAKWTHCSHGHEFTPENTYVRPDTGTRQCRICRRDALRRLQSKRAAVAA